MKHFLSAVLPLSVFVLSGCIDDGDGGSDQSIRDTLDRTSLKESQQVNQTIVSGGSRQLSVDFSADSADLINSDRDIVEGSYESGVLSIEAQSVDRPHVVSLMLSDPQRSERSLQVKVSVFTQFGAQLRDTIHRWIDHQNALSDFREQNRAFNLFSDIAYSDGALSQSKISDYRDEWQGFIESKSSSVDTALSSMDDLINQYQQSQLSDDEFESEFHTLRAQIEDVTGEAQSHVSGFRDQYTDEDSINWGDLRYIEQSDLVSSVTGHSAFGFFDDNEWVFDDSFKFMEYISNTTAFRFCEMR